MFRIDLEDRDGTRDAILYDQHTSRITRLDGTPFPFDRAPKSFEGVPDAFALSPENPAGKTHHIKRLKIQLGLSCNYTCSYCLQSAHIPTASKTNTRDATIFLKRLDSWLLHPEEVTKIELWGGEPLLYWRKFEILVPELKRRCPNAQFSIVTNGSLLTDEIAQKLYDWGFAIGISHDGPGQHVRGPDPLDDPDILGRWQRAISLFGDRIAINAVISPASFSPKAIQAWFDERLPGVALSYEGVVHDYDGDTSARFSPEQLQALTAELIECMLSPDQHVRRPFTSKMKRTIEAFIAERPSRVLGQKCGMDREDAISVDLLGNVSTCQNVGGSGHHRIGSIQDFASIKLDTATHWSLRPECSGCPVLQLCAGSCMYQEGEGWINSCRAEYAYNLAFLIAVMSILTGKRVISVTK